jgi:hypothetical protein
VIASVRALVYSDDPPDVHDEARRSGGDEWLNLLYEPKHRVADDR